MNQIFQIKHKITGGMLFEAEVDSLKLCVEAAVKSKANLSRADLREADLREADLWGASLRGANLYRAEQIIDLGCPNDWVAFGWLHNGWLSIRVGCCEKRLEQARDYWTETHPYWGKRQAQHR